jgi:uncharacterized protein (UPF0548 family)
MERMLKASQSSEPTFTDTGASLTGRVVSGFTRLHDEMVLGRGLETFARAVEGLQQWKAHNLLGFAIFPKAATIAVGSTIMVHVGTPILALSVPCRIVGVVDEASRWGFAYATLPGHPEQGEEAFEVTMAADQTVRFAVTAISRPADPLVRLAGPVGRLVQARATKGYLRSLNRFVQRAG